MPDPITTEGFPLTKRETFAIVALAGLLAANPDGPGAGARFVRQAVEYADAMIAALAGDQ